MSAKPSVYTELGRWSSVALVGFEWIIPSALVLILVCWMILRRHEIAQEVKFVRGQEPRELKDEERSETGGIAALTILTLLGLLITFVMPILGIGLLLGGIVGLLVYDDAYKREDPNAGAWGLGTALLLIVVVPIYLYHRSQSLPPFLQGRTAFWQQVESEPRASHTNVSDAAILTMFCRECGANLLRDSKFCKECGTKVIL